MEENIPLNVVVFEYKQNGQTLRGTASSSTSKEEAIINGIQTFDNINSICDNKLELINFYSEWKPSEELENQIKKKYPNVNISYSFTEDDENKFEHQMYKIYSNNQNENESSNQTIDKKKWWEFWK